MRFRRQQEVKPTKIEIIPMIDTMFFLLVFFMLTSIGLVQVAVGGVRLPPAKTGEKRLKAAEITLGIDARGGIKIDNQPIAVGADAGVAILDRITKRNIKIDRDKVKVLIQADEEVENQVVVKAMDQVRKVGFTNFDIGTAPYVGTK